MARARWEQLAPREQVLVALMAVLVLGALLWLLALAPALRTVRSAPAQLAVLENQWQSMQGLAAQARAIQGRAPVTREEAVRELEASVRQRLGGNAQLTLAADRATVVLKGAAPQALAPWLSHTRLKARVVASQASLVRGPTGWDGTVVFLLPAAP